MKEKDKGITLIAIIITIVVMLILATVTIGAINGELFEYAGKVKKDTEEVAIVEQIGNSFIMAKGKSKTGRVTASDMQTALNKTFGSGVADAIDNNGTIVVKIGNNYYEVDKKGNVKKGTEPEPTE